MHPQPPLRELPEHSVSEPQTTPSGTGNAPFGLDGAADEKSEEPTTTEPKPTDKPVFTEPDFGAGTATEAREDIMSPGTEKEEALSPSER